MPDEQVDVVEELRDEDWEAVFGECGYNATATAFSMQPPGTPGDPRVTRSDVEEVLHIWGSEHYYGEWDGAMVGRLKDGRFVAAHGWCDTSGWG